MKISFEGMGQWSATFACGTVAEGAVVKLAGSGCAEACGAGEAFGGVVLSRGRDGEACAVQLGGAATAAYTGTAPQAGWAKLAGNGNGGVQTQADGREYLVLEVNQTAKTVTFVL